MQDKSVEKKKECHPQITSLFVSLRLCHCPSVFTWLMVHHSSLLTFSQVLPLEKLKQQEVLLVWKLPMAPSDNAPWPKA